MPIKDTKKGLAIKVKVQPKAKKDEILGVEGNRIKLRIKAPPEKGRANEACIILLAKVLGITKKEVKLVFGATAREKIFLIQGMKLKEIKERLGVK
jgi:hypothetical protein